MEGSGLGLRFNSDIYLTGQVVSRRSFESANSRLQGRHHNLSNNFTSCVYTVHGRKKGNPTILEIWFYNHRVDWDEFCYNVCKYHTEVKNLATKTYLYYKDPVRTAQRTSWLRYRVESINAVHREIVSVYCKDKTE